MNTIKTWVDWAILALGMAAALGAVFFGINQAEASVWARSSQPHAALVVLGAIAALAIVNGGFLVGAALCKARGDGRRGSP